MSTDKTMNGPHASLRSLPPEGAHGACGRPGGAMKPGPKGPHGKRRIVHGTLRQKAWLAMQIKGKFSLSDLVRNAVPEGSTDKAPRNNISRYVRALTNVGVLAEMKHRLPPASLTSNGEKRWLLVRDLGRQAPVARSGREVYDPNAQAVLTAPVTGEEADDGQ